MIIEAKNTQTYLLKRATICENDDVYAFAEDCKSDVTCFIRGLDVPQKNATSSSKTKFIAQEKI